MRFAKAIRFAESVAAIVGSASPNQEAIVKASNKYNAGDNFDNVMVINYLKKFIKIYK
jgi:hypothetical protein